MRFRLSQEWILWYVLLFPIIFSIPGLPLLIGAELAIPYFLSLNALICLSLIAQRRSVSLYNYQKIDLLYLLCILALMIWSYSSIRYIWPHLFVGTWVLLVVWFGGREHDKVRIRKIVICCISIYLIASIMLLIDPSRFALKGRYSGFMLSATTYSVTLIAIVIAGLASIKGKFWKLVFFVIFGIFIVLSQTRLSILFYLVLPFVWLLTHKIPKLRSPILIIYFVALQFVYPVYSYLNKEGATVDAFRQEKGKDPSFVLRNNLFKFSWEKFEEGTPFQKLFGRGSEYNRLAIEREYGRDLLPHYDSLRFLIDFGIIPSVLILILFWRTVRYNRVAYHLGLLYLLIFYNNMIYNVFMLGLILIFSHGSKTRNWYE